MSDTVLTKKGKAQLEKELKHLEEVVLPEIQARMAKAREDGDLSENNAWITAKSDREITKLNISKLKRTIKTATIIEDDAINTTEDINIGDTVTFKMNGKEMKVKLVPTLEANPAEKKLSSDSPIGKAIMGHKVGEKVLFTTPSGEQEIEIISQS